MVERRLSQTQVYVVTTLVKQRDALAQQIAEINAAIQEQAELLRAKFALPEGVYQFFGDEQGIKLVRREEAVEAAEIAE